MGRYEHTHMYFKFGPQSFLLPGNRLWVNLSDCWYNWLYTDYWYNNQCKEHLWFNFPTRQETMREGTFIPSCAPEARGAPGSLAALHRRWMNKWMNEWMSCQWPEDCLISKRSILDRNRHFDTLNCFVSWFPLIFLAPSFFSCVFMHMWPKANTLPKYWPAHKVTNLLSLLKSFLILACFNI